MAARKKRAKPQAKVAAKLDNGWETFIDKALKKRPTGALWPDPVGDVKWKPTDATKKSK